MKKLNNNGWGLSTFIAFIAVFCIAIILIIVGSVRLEIGNDSFISKLPVAEIKQTSANSISEEDYYEQVKNYQEQLTDVSKDYIKTNSEAVSKNDTLTITVVSLVKDNYISKLEIKGYTCTGYITIFNNNGTYKYKPIVNCGNGYVTENYDSNLDETF